MVGVRGGREGGGEVCEEKRTGGSLATAKQIDTNKRSVDITRLPASPPPHTPHHHHPTLALCEV